MHTMAKALQEAGITVYVPDLRGHGDIQPHGDVAYIGQLDDDLADFINAMHPHHRIRPSLQVRIPGGCS
jgi:non-heme chloroperoxidase